MKKVFIGLLFSMATSAVCTAAASHVVIPEHSTLYSTSKDCEAIKTLGFNNHSAYYGEVLWETKCNFQTYVTIRWESSVFTSLKSEAIPVD